MMRGKTFLITAAAAVLASSVPAAAQLTGTNGDQFLKAVRDTDGDKATQLLDANGSTVVNYRDASGDTGLTIAAKRRDATWLAFLLSRGADANAPGAGGDTPLMIAARLGWDDGASILLARGARVDATNRRGETALIIAVQQRQSGIAQTLLEQGANPDKTDHAAGYSARDYARRDNRSQAMLKLIETVKPTTKIKAGPILR